MSKYTYSQLEDLWTQAGGNPASAAMAAAIAMAESGGNSDSTHSNSNGTIDRGLWQINSIHGSQSTLDPLANAKAAVAISQNGTTWRPWCTAWSNGNCSGSYQGVGSPYLKFLSGSGQGTTNTAGRGGSDLPGTTSSGSPIPGLDAIGGTANSVIHTLGVWGLYGGMTFLGTLLTIVGIGMLIWNTKTFSETKAAIVGIASRGAVRTKVKEEPESTEE